MIIDDVLKSMSRRIPWSVASIAMYAAGLPRGKGWDRTRATYQDKKKKTDGLGPQLAEVLRDHIRVGEKLTRLWRVQPNELDQIKFAAGALKLEVCSEATRYPLLTSDGDLVIDGRAPRLIAREVIPAGVALIYTSVRTSPERQALPDEAAGAEQEGRDVEAVYAVINVPFQAFDVVFLPNEGDFVEFRVDYPAGAQLDVAEAAASRLEAIVSDFAGLGPQFASVNAFPLIDSLYGDQAEGIVVELDFDVSAGSSHSARARKNGVNLRVDPYHTAGVKGLSAPIEPHSISLRWSLPVDKKRNSTPELTLHSTSTERGKASPLLRSMIVRKCSDDEDFGYVMQRVFSHLGTP